MMFHLRSFLMIWLHVYTKLNQRLFYFHVTMSCLTINNPAQLWDLRKRQQVVEYRGHIEAVEACHFLSTSLPIGDSSRQPRLMVATASRDCSVRLWDMMTGGVCFICVCSSFVLSDIKSCLCDSKTFTDIQPVFNVLKNLNR